MNQRQIRVIKKTKSGEYDSYALSVPKDYYNLFKDIFYSIRREGNKLIFESGCKAEFTREELTKYNFEDCRING